MQAIEMKLTPVMKTFISNFCDIQKVNTAYSTQKIWQFVSKCILMPFLLAQSQIVYLHCACVQETKDHLPGNCLQWMYIYLLYNMIQCVMWIDNNNVMSVIDNKEYPHMNIYVKLHYTDETMSVIGNNLVTAIEISSIKFLCCS